jgi:hypothetical protein
MSQKKKRWKTWVSSLPAISEDVLLSDEKMMTIPPMKWSTSILSSKESALLAALPPLKTKNPTPKATISTPKLKEDEGGRVSAQAVKGPQAPTLDEKEFIRHELIAVKPSISTTSLVSQLWLDVETVNKYPETSKSVSKFAPMPWAVGQVGSPFGNAVIQAVVCSENLVMGLKGAVESSKSLDKGFLASVLAVKLGWNIPVYSYFLPDQRIKGLACVKEFMSKMGATEGILVVNGLQEMENKISDGQFQCVVCVGGADQALEKIGNFKLVAVIYENEKNAFWTIGRRGNALFKFDDNMISKFDNFENDHIATMIFNTVGNTFQT